MSAPWQGPPVLEAEGLSVTLDVPAGRLHAVSDIDLAVHAGETLCLVGESGCGKSMTALALMKLLPRRGKLAARRLTLEGRDLLPLGERAMNALRGERIGLISQDPMTALNPVYTIGNQLEEIHRRHRGGSRAAARERAEYLLSRVGIASPGMRLGQYPHQLSGGLRQRMLIAAALMCGPALLIADEPTTALDVTVQAEILRLFADLQREFRLALVLITHDLGVVARIGHQVAVMYGGRVVETGTVAEVFRAPHHPYTRGLMDCIPAPGARREARLGAIPGIVEPAIGERAGCGFRNRCVRAQPDCGVGDIHFRPLGTGHAYRCLLPPDAALARPRPVAEVPAS
ncbi:MAG TPA: ABC transporter ATP-binding protein [Hyphomicrobiales bacterium]|nr:ABC transporter ATP-binding protein [Hyphomicrobiales bacterium]